ncbi:zinc finger protein 592 [Kryptolebias marmoratus]|uniref:Zinc finger protein 592 n=1 Tax=Kryptolebias marmoratus TaxID=37003 RepID=A0A3Q3B0Z7_KRYMA|nr:zinc finger protein 592 [Kryptolebias marmoratus]
MGDMKTPDFDDLLAAFDIPDATGLDAKEPIQGNHEEAENQLKHTGMCLDDSLLNNQAVTAADIPLVSVIVKNTSRQESLEGFGEELHSGQALQNGFKGRDVDPAELVKTDFPNSFQCALNGETSREAPEKTPVPQKTNEPAIFSRSPSHFSPVSSPGLKDALRSVDKIVSKEETTCFSDSPLLEEPLAPDNQNSLDLCMFDNSPNNTQGSSTENGGHDALSDIGISNETEGNPEIHSAFPSSSIDQDCSENNCNSESTVDATAFYSPAKSQTPKLSSCLEALVALNARKDPGEQTNPRESSSMQNDCIKASHKVTMSPISPRSPLEVVKRLVKPSDSPMSICSDSSGKASPAVASGSSAAIPRVRIKTIKTTSGQIKRTVTSVLPDSETDEIHAYESSPSQSMISEDSYSNASPRQPQTVDCVVGMQSKGRAASATSPKVLHRKSEEKSRNAETFRSTSCSVKKSGAHKAHKPRKAAAAAGQAPNTNLLPQAMHLASLNLVPHSVAASVAARPASHPQNSHILSSTVCSTVPLVHQVKTANPYPRSFLPNTAAGTLNRLLTSTNPVPVYVPNLSPPPESDISLPSHGYCCLECGDSFGIERSLAYHYNRRSVHIEVGCTHCAKTLVFFNKCALLAHAREHKSGGVVMQCTQLHLKPISEEQMFVPLSADVAPAGPHTLPLLSPKSEPVLPLYPDNVIRHRLRCLECNKQLPDYKALAGHYQKSSDVVEGLICKVCSMLLPNKCSFRAHQRIHAHKSPYCCPECGALSRSADIQKHVRENCLHYARKAWYKCLHCDMVFRTLQGQKIHIEEKHCEVFYKCCVCPVAFKTSDSCEAHLKHKHSTNKQSPLLVFKCSCEAVFKKKQLFFQHFLQNANKRVTCVFKCPECNSVFPQKRLLVHHFKSVHAGNMTAEAAKDTKEEDKTDCYSESHSLLQQRSQDARKLADGPRRRSEQDGRSRAKPSGWTCGECLQWFAERESYVSHMKTDHGKSVKKYPCRHCEQSFISATSLRRHVRSEHDGKRRIYSCWYCTDTKTIFTTSVMLKNHISLMHGIKNPDLGQMPKTSIQEFKKADKESVSAPPAASAQADGRDRAGPEAPSAKRLKTQFRCSKCGFVTARSAEFQQHIPQHKRDENTPQCLHCGLCFTSVFSLSRHLFIVHKVKDPEEEREEEEEEEEEGDVGGKEPDSGWVTSADADGMNDFEPSLEGEPENPHCSETTDSNLQLNTHSQTEAATLQQ